MGVTVSVTFFSGLAVTTVAILFGIAYNKPRLYLNLLKPLVLIPLFAFGGLAGGYLATLQGTIKIAFLTFNLEKICLSEDCIAVLDTIRHARDLYSSDIDMYRIIGSIGGLALVVICLAAALAIKARSDDHAHTNPSGKSSAHQGRREKHQTNKVIRAALRRQIRESRITHTPRPPEETGLPGHDQ